MPYLTMQCLEKCLPNSSRSRSPQKTLGGFGVALPL